MSSPRQPVRPGYLAELLMRKRLAVLAAVLAWILDPNRPDAG